MYRKVLFTQFAIPSYDTLEYRSNVHLAPGYLVGFLKDKFPDIEFVISPRIYTDVLSESDFIDYVLELAPDLISFSLYLWNIDKSLRVAQRIKDLLPEIDILFGGPEVNPDNKVLLNSDIFTHGLVGEGEIAFAKFLSGNSREEIGGYLSKDYYNKNFELRKEYKRNQNPYLEELIEIKPDRTLFFETVRGCPFSCNFCYYNKVYDKVQSVAHDQIDEVFDYARKNNIRELFLLDPTFNVQPDFDNLLDRLIKLNSDHYFSISTELRADLLSDEQIEKLKAINIVEVEIGLQTSNPEALEAMGRDNRVFETIERTQKLIKAGIRGKVDLIIALPGDNLEGFKKSIDDVVAAGIADSIQVFRLSILSGTDFSERREALGLEVETESPYYLVSNPSFSQQDINEAIDYAQEQLGIDLYPISAALMSTNFENLDDSNLVYFDSDIIAVHKVLVESSGFELTALESNNFKLCESLNVHIILNGDSLQKENVMHLIAQLYENNPWSKYQFVVDLRKNIDLEFLMQLNQAIPDSKPDYLVRDIRSNTGLDIDMSKSITVIVPIEFLEHELCSLLQDQCELYINVDAFDSELIDELYLDNKLYFSGKAQAEAFAYLSEKGALDQYTIFEDYYYELKKEKQDKRVYPANMIVL